MCYLDDMVIIWEVYELNYIGFEFWFYLIFNLRILLVSLYFVEIYSMLEEFVVLFS